MMLGKAHKLEIFIRKYHQAEYPVIAAIWLMIYESDWPSRYHEMYSGTLKIYKINHWLDFDQTSQEWS